MNVVEVVPVALVMATRAPGHVRGIFRHQRQMAGQLRGVPAYPRVVPVATAMPRMLKVLSQHPELGCPGFQRWSGRTAKALRGAGPASRSGRI